MGILPVVRQWWTAKNRALHDACAGSYGVWSPKVEDRYFSADVSGIPALILDKLETKV